MIGLRSSDACFVGRVFSAHSWSSDLRLGIGFGLTCSWLLIALFINCVRSVMGEITRVCLVWLCLLKFCGDCVAQDCVY